MILISIIIAFVALIIATITDLKKREVPDYVSYGLIIIAFAISVVYSIINWDYIFFAQSVMGFILGLIIAYAMFYLGQWGGGDSKLIMGLGAILGFNIFPLFGINVLGENNFWLIILLANIIFFGAVYGLGWSIMLAIKNRKNFTKHLIEWTRRKEIVIIRRIVLIAIVLLIIFTLIFIPENFRLMMLTFIMLFYITFYIWIFVKVIEESCMVKELPIAKLTEGDWIYRDVKIGKKYITGPKELGVSREQIMLLKKYSKQGKIKTVTIKEGIPFIPAFLLAFIATIALYYMNVF
jgi:Flp pilus assembly protein protease CpaA